MSAASKKKLKILWAVDALDDFHEGQEKQVNVLQALARKTETDVHPMYVLSPVSLGVNLDFSSEWEKTYAPPTRKTMGEKLRGVSIPGLQDPQVLTHDRATLKGAVESLTKFAKENSFDLIVAGSYGNKGLKRMLLGSFAEELVLRAETPVLIVGNHSNEWNDSNMRILLPNDLTDVKSPLFTEVFNFAEKIGAGVTILNSIPRPVDQVVQSGVYLISGGWISTPVYMENERAQRMEVVGKIADQAKQRNIPCDVVVDDAALSVTESILKCATEKRAHFIAMAAESGPAATLLLGSIARQVVRSAPCPVLVYRFKNRL